MTTSLYSFDVFDTVLTRLVGRPSSLFVLLGHRAAQSGHWLHSPERFASARVAAEARARVHIHPGEVTLRRIYEELAFAHALAPAAVLAIGALEQQLEGTLLRAVPAARLAVEAARHAGDRVAFISDIYLPRGTVRGWLAKEGLVESGDEVWVSSESGATKASGALFDEVRLAASPAPARWRHLGDHPQADVTVPRSTGIDAKLWDACALSRYEEQMERHTAGTGALSSLLAGAARWVRLSQPHSTAVQLALRDIAAGVAGPVLWAFVTWVLRRAQREGLRRVWFTARDGQVMLSMARRIAPRLGIEIELGYLFGGRQVVHLAGLHAIDERALKWLVGGAGAVTAAALLERVGLVPDEVSEALTRHQIPVQGPIGWSRAQALEGFFRDPAVTAAVLAKAAERRDDMRSYFSACGLMSGDACAVVDIGWRGSVLRSMFDILGCTAAARHHFLYFGLFGRPKDVPEARMSAFLFDTSGTTMVGAGHDVPSLTAAMEIFCQADHGQVIHVERQGEAHVPRLRAVVASPPTLWDVDYFQDCLEAFAEAVQVDLAIDSDADLRPMCEQLLRTLMKTPDAAEARVLGSVQYVDDQGGTTSQPFAHPFGFADWRAAIRTGQLPHKALAWWEQGAWALTPESVRLWLRAARKIGVLRQRRATPPTTRC